MVFPALWQVPQFERLLVDEGVSLTKFWFSVTPGEQHTRFAIRQIGLSARQRTCGKLGTGDCRPLRSAFADCGRCACLPASRN